MQFEGIDDEDLKKEELKYSFITPPKLIKGLIKFSGKDLQNIEDMHLQIQKTNISNADKDNYESR